MSYQVLQTPKGQPDKRWNIFARMEKSHVILFWKLTQIWINIWDLTIFWKKIKCFWKCLTRYCRVLRDNLTKGGISLPDWKRHMLLFCFQKSRLNILQCLLSIDNCGPEMRIVVRGLESTEQNHYCLNPSWKCLGKFQIWKCQKLKSTHALKYGFCNMKTSQKARKKC